MLRTLFTCLFLLSTQHPTLAQSSVQSDSPPAETSLTVGVSHVPPFAIKTGDDWDGIGVHLWREVAHELNLDYQWRELQPDEVAEQVQNGTVDIAIAAIATAPAEQKIDFTQSYFVSSLGFAKPRQRSLLSTAKSVLSPQFLKICLWLSLILIFIGVLIWLLERHKNEAMFDRHPARGIWSGFWWAGVTMTTIGYGDKAPITVGGRILALLWMLIAMGITASLTAYLTSSVLGQGTVDTSLQELETLSVGSVANSSSAQVLEQEQIQFQPFSAPVDGLRAVRNGDIDVFVYNNASLQYLNQNSLQNTLIVESTGIQTRQYAFALPENDELQEPLNRQMLQELSEPDWQDLVKRYLPQTK